jgi:hypothetical protein
MSSRTPGSRLALFVGCVGLGILAALVSIRADDYEQAAVSFIALTALGAVFGFSRSEWAIAQTDDADERQKSLNTQAMLFAYYAVLAVAIIGLFGELGRDEVGAFTLVCAVGGFTHMLSLAILRLVR